MNNIYNLKDLYNILKKYYDCKFDVEHGYFERLYIDKYVISSYFIGQNWDGRYKLMIDITNDENYNCDNNWIHITEGLTIEEVCTILKIFLKHRS